MDVIRGWKLECAYEMSTPLLQKEEEGYNTTSLLVAHKNNQEPEEQNPEPAGIHVFRNVLLEIRDDADRKRCIGELKHLWNRHNYFQAQTYTKER